jgi:hypothetical protein
VGGHQASDGVGDSGANGEVAGCAVDVEGHGEG